MIIILFKVRSKKLQLKLLAADPFAFDLQDTLRVIAKSKTNPIRIDNGRWDLSRSARRSASVRLRSGLGGSHDALR